MKRLLIGTCIAVLLGAAAPAMADDHRGFGHPPGIQKQLDRGKALPPGHQKKQFLQAHYRRDHHDSDRRDRKKNRHHKRDRDHYGRYDRGHHHRDKGRHFHQKDRYDRHHYHREYRVHIGFDGHVPPEYRVARIIHNTRELIESSHR